MEGLRGSGDVMVRVLVADDTRIHTQLLADALKRDEQLEIIGSLSHSEELLEAANLQDFDVVVISSNLDEEPLRGFEVLRQLRASNPEIRAVVLLDSSKREIILQAFRAGAKGIFSRHESVETLSKCIRSVHHGQIWANSQQMSYAVEALAASPIVRAVDANGLSLLSKRELDVVRSLADGLTNREIAERLGLSQHTIKNYLFRVFDKLGVSSRLELLFMTLTQASNAHLANPAPTANRNDGNEGFRVAKSGSSPRKSQTKSSGSPSRPEASPAVRTVRYPENHAPRLRMTPGADAERSRAEKKQPQNAAGTQPIAGPHGPAPFTEKFRF